MMIEKGLRAAFAQPSGSWPAAFDERAGPRYTSEGAPEFA